MLPGILAFLVPDVLPPGSAGDDADSFHFEPIGPFRGDVRALLADATRPAIFSSAPNPTVSIFYAWSGISFRQRHGSG